MTEYNSAAVLDGNMADAQHAGAVLCRTAEYTIVTELAIDDIVNMIPIPKGAIILDCKLQADAGTTAGVLDVGLTSGTGNELLDGVVVAAAAAQADMYNADVSTGHLLEITANDMISVKALGAVYGVGKTIKLAVIYTMKGLFSDL